MTTFRLHNTDRTGKFNTSWDHFILFLALFFSTSFLATNGFIPGTIRIFPLVAILLFHLISVRTVILKSSSLIAFLCICFTMLMASMIHGDSFYNFSILLLGGVFTGYLFTINYNFDQFCKIYINILTALAAISLVFFAVVCIYPKLISFFPTVGTWFGQSIKSAGLFTWIEGGVFPRNYGMFWEPGAYQTFLNLALFFQLFIVKKSSGFKCLLLSTTILTTFSTTGYVCLAIIFIALMFDINIKTSRNKTRSKMFRTFLLFLIITLVVFYFVDIQDNVFGKLTGIFSGKQPLSHSAQTRLNSVKYPFDAFLDAPLLGIGYDGFLVLNKTLCNNNATFTPINWFALYGIFFGMINIIGYFSLLKYCKIRSSPKIVLFLFLLFLVSSESYYSNPLIFTLIFYGYEGTTQNEKDTYCTGNVSTASVRKRNLL